MLMPEEIKDSCRNLSKLRIDSNFRRPRISGQPSGNVERIPVYEQIFINHLELKRKKAAHCDAASGPSITSTGSWSVP